MQSLHQQKVLNDDKGTKWKKVEYIHKLTSASGGNSSWTPTRQTVQSTRCSRSGRPVSTRPPVSVTGGAGDGEEGGGDRDWGG